MNLMPLPAIFPAAEFTDNLNSPTEPIFNFFQMLPLHKTYHVHDIKLYF